MSVDETRAVWERFKAADQAHDAEAMKAVYAEDVVLKGMPLRGRDAVVGLDGFFFAAFPDYRREYLQDLIGDEAVAFTWRMTGTHSGRFFGVEATGHRVEHEGCSVLTVRDGFVAEAQSFGPDVLGELRKAEKTAR